MSRTHSKIDKTVAEVTINIQITHSAETQTPKPGISACKPFRWLDTSQKSKVACVDSA
jgi:hypothetical protein